ncbi:hypothetical protein K457DRAFT_23993 [Linnemannia elongata AG-77]|uniref:Uncharacterized protein n=1 Tax=Linnemannia elongata AG-77 TaxID=1314771 RepID=A0A197JHS5_9FUNG|nr:hypothetical protein K457DRAFT_23993 [Linnemannia elongata AG-77]
MIHLNTSTLFTTVSQLYMPDEDRTTLQMANESSLTQLTTPAPVLHNLSNQPLSMAKNGCSSENVFVYQWTGTQTLKASSTTIVLYNTLNQKEPINHRSLLQTGAHGNRREFHRTERYPPKQQQQQQQQQQQ